MQRFLLLGVGLLFLFNFTYAQNCPANPTYKNTSGTYNFSTPGSSYVVNNGTTVNVTILTGFSSTSSICVTNGSTLNLSFSILNVVATGGTIYVDATSKLNLTGSNLTNFPFTLTSYGTVNQNIDLTFGEGAVLNNFGTYTTNNNITVNGTTVTFNNSGMMDFSGATTFNSTTFSINNALNSTLTFKKDAVFNFAKITNKGTLNFNATAIFNSMNLLYNSGTVNFTGQLSINVGTITNYGLMSAKGGISINSGVYMTNYCTITDDKDFTFNAGTFTNYGNLLLKTNGNSSFTTQGNFINGPNGFVQGSNFSGNGNISGGGNFYFQNNTLNNGNFGGTASSYINFYDATPTAGKFFDIQSTTPPYTTKNAISPMSTTGFTACGDPAPPVITTQPTDVNLCDNSITTATFSVVAFSPYSSMTYQWKKNGSNISGATSSSYTATGLTLADTANVYTVAVTNNLGTTTSNGASVNFIIIAQPAPASLYLATGSSATFTIKTSGATAWQWKKNSTNVPGATSNVFTNASVKLPDGGSYTALVTYSSGTCTSNAAVLTVENLPVINTQPQQQVLCTGTTSATFSVAATSTSAMTYQWYKNNATIAGATSASYTASGLTLSDTTNTYYVVVKNGVGSTTSSTTGLKYLIITQPASQYVATGTAVTFSVTVSTVATGFQWEKNGVNIPGATARTYTIAAAAASDAANYTVVVNYAGGSCTSNAATLTVENLPAITTQPSKINLCDVSSTSATFTVAATSTSAMTYQWKKNGVDITGATSSSYTATGLTFNDTTNTYSVAITNRAGTTLSNNASVHYVIIAQPAPASLYLATGSAATFTIKTSGATAWQWQRNSTNVAGAITNIYNNPAVKLTDGGNYTTLVTYNGGSCTSSAAVLTVENLPVITAQPQTPVLCSGTTSATFSVAATSTSAMTYQWYKNGTAISGATAASYTATGLTMADTLSDYGVKITNGVGSTMSNNTAFKYLIVKQPISQYVATGTAVSFAVNVSTVATGFQWQKNGVNIAGATARTYTIPAAALTNAGNYTVLVTYAGGNCTSNTATLTVENPPVINTQPQLQVLCNNSTTSAMFSVAATSVSALSYQWYKNGTAIANATTSSYTATGLTFNDTTNTYYVALTNGVGTTISNSVGLKYLIVAQPAPATAYLATGNNITFTATASSVASAFQWNKNGIAISGATALSYQINPVTTTSAGNYTLSIAYSGGTCTTNAAVLQTSITLYSKANGNMDAPATWGVNTDGSGSTPVDFTRDEHTFVVANRSTITNTSNLIIAGKLDLNNGTVTIAPGTTLTAGRIIRSGTTGVLAGSATSSLSVQGISTAAYSGTSDLYFQTGNNILQYLTTAGHAVTLHTALDLTAGSTPGILKVTSGSFSTSNLLTLKSDALGTAMVGISAGTINGKVTIERFIPARRAWRLMCAPITSLSAPTINAAWQEGAISSTDNPHPGYGTHITYGATADGYDQNPQKTFSMYFYSGGKWTGIPATNQTPVSNYTGYLFFIRGNRSYDILNTTSTTTPSTTILRTTGYLNQGTQAGVPVNNTGFTMVGNPYASPIDFEQVYNSSANILHNLRVWDPSLAGTKGVGAYVTLDWVGNGYKATPPSSVTSIIQPYQAFFVQSTSGTAGTVNINEAAKSITTSKSPFGRSMTARETPDAMLEINLRVFNDDSTTGIADGVLYHFNDAYNNGIDDNDIIKLNNMYENLSINSNNALLTVERRRMPAVNDTLHLSLTGTKTTSYQLEIIPQSFSKKLFLYDNYLNTLLPVSLTDTNHFTISINTSDALSKAADRFSIVMSNDVVLPVTFSTARAYAKGKTAQVEWTVAGELEVQHYEVERSANGTTFTKAGEVMATGTTNYSFNDAIPFTGDSYYRVKSVDKSGKATYTNILPVTIKADNAASGITIYPNPLQGKAFTIELNNKAAGNYTLVITTIAGRQVFTQDINYKGGFATYHVELKNVLANGVYLVKTIAGNGATDVLKVVVE